MNNKHSRNRLYTIYETKGLSLCIHYNYSLFLETHTTHIHIKMTMRYKNKNKQKRSYKGIKLVFLRKPILDNENMLQRQKIRLSLFYFFAKTQFMIYAYSCCGNGSTHPMLFLVIYRKYLHTYVMPIITDHIATSKQPLWM